MKSFENFVSFFLIVSILSMNAGVFVSPVFAFEKEDTNFERNQNNLLPKISKESSYIKKEFREKVITDRQVETKLNKNETKSLESFKSVGKIDQERKNYVEGEVLVKFKEQKIKLEQYSGRVKARQFATNKNLDKKEDIRNSNISVLKTRGNESVENMIKRLKNDPNVEYVEPNYKRYPATINSNDTYKNLLWGLDNIGQEVNGITGTNDADIDIPEAWVVSEGGSDVIVAVIDTGVAYNHPDLIANMWDGSACVDENNGVLGGCNHGYDYEDEDKNPLPINSSHGTHIAGTIGAVKNNSKGIIGVAPNVKIMAIKSSLTTNEIVKAINFAIQNGAKIINASFAGEDYSQSEYDAINVFKNAGGLFIVAAGNETNNNDAGVHYYPCDYDLDNIISVAATNQNDDLTSFSNYGITSVDVGAPGKNIYSTVAGETYYGTEILSETFEGITTPNVPDGWLKEGTNNHWGTYDRTSTWGSEWGKVLYGDLNPEYLNNVDTTITSLTYNLGAAGGAQIDFWARCDTEYDTDFWRDYMVLEVSSDGSSFAELDLGLGDGKFDEYTLDDINGESPLDSSGSADYHFENINIPSQYLTNNFKFRFKWHTDSSDNNYDGCAIDDIKITKYSDGSDEQYDYKNGTSMAAPHVAGLAGLIWGYKSDLSYSQVKDIILTTGDSLLSLSGKTVTGKRINAYNALNSIDVTAPTLSEVTPVSTSTNDNTPDYTFNSNEVGTIAYAGGCTSAITNAVAGNNTITFNTLDDGIYDSCTITVTDTDNNTSIPLQVSTFTIDTISPVITLTDSPTVNLYVDDSYADAGATAMDDVDGDITAKIITINPVNTSIADTYIITYNVSDAAGNPAIEVIRTVIVSEVPDTTAPIVILSGTPANPTNLTTTDITINGEDVIYYKYKLDDGNYSDEEIEVSIHIALSGLSEGEHTIYVIGRDTAGNWQEEVNATAYTWIIDITAPTLTVVSQIISPTNDATPNFGFNSSEVGTISYSGSCSSETTEATEGENTIAFNELVDGTYSNCNIIVTDTSGNPSDLLTISEFIIDTVVPIIALLGDNPASIEVGNAYIDAGATAEDNNDGNIIGNIITVNPVDGNVIGSYVVTYNVADSAGNPATEVTRTVNVVDTTVPVITLLESDSVTLEVGTTYNDAGATASDNYDGNITANIITINPVNSNTIGVYIVTYNVIDSSGNAAIEITRTVNVVDTTSPVIILLGENPITIPVNTAYDDAGVTASDNYDGVITDNIVTVNPVDINTIGTYYVTYNISDATGNSADEVIRTVNIVDISTPIIILLGDNPVTIEIGITYNDAGATASDNVDGDITADIITVNPVNTNILGSYIITYNVSDSSGNSAPEVTRAVNVVDTTIPVITLLGDETINIKVGDKYEDQGATAIDDIDGDLTSSITVINPVDINTAGIYTITYNVSDLSDNAAEEVTRTVNVNEVIAPIAYFAGPVAGDRTELVITFNEALHADTLAISDIAFLFDSVLNDATGTSMSILVDSEANSVIWDNNNVNAPIATISIPSTTFVGGQTLRINFTENAVKDLVENVVLNTTNIDAIVLASTQIAASPTVTVDTTQTEVVITSNQSTSITVPGDVTNATININLLITDNGTNATATLSKIDLNVNTSISGTPVEIAIPADTIISAPTGWNGVINAPKIESNSSVSVIPDSGNTATVSSVIEIGYGDVELIFSKAVRILIPGAAGKYVGYSRSGTFTQITTACSADTQIAGDSLGVGGNCKIDVGSDKVIWTKHFTKFITYTQSVIQSSGGGGGGGGDRTAPGISKIEITTTDTDATITWKTNESSISWIVYGTSTDYDLEEKTTTYTTSHSIKLSDLSQGTIYHYQIKSKDRSGNIGKYTDKSFTAVEGSSGISVADINNDSKVDKYDFSMMMASWGKTGSNNSDLNNDNKVDKYDFALLMANWGAK